MSTLPDGVYVTTLENGLKVILQEIHSAPVVTTWAWYNVGSKNERPGVTGVSHWVEHMLFKGTQKLQKGDIFRLVNKYGGYNNGFTSEDWTVYFETLPADRLDLGLDFEADRMVNSRFDPEEVDSERTVIISEREGGENRPQFLLGEEFRAAAFRVHPYRWSVIGDKCDLRAITRDDLYGHYRAYYGPNNCTLIVVGDFETGRALERIRHYYGGIERPVSPPPVRSVEPPQRGERRIRVHGPGGTAYLQIGFHTPAFGHPDTYPLMMLDAVLSGGKSLGFGSGGWMGRSARLNRCLVLEKRLAVSASSAFRPSPDPDLFTFSMTVKSGVEIEAAEAAMLEEIERTAREPVSDHEMEKAAKQIASQVAYGKDGVTSNAFTLGYANSLGDPTLADGIAARLGQVTKEDLLRVAAAYLAPQNRTVGWFLPGESAAGGGVEAALPAALPRLSHGPFFATGGVGEGLEREVMDSGVTLLLIESHTSPSVTLIGSVGAGGAAEPEDRPGAAAMTAHLLQRGTLTRSAVEIADAVESVGASISFGSGREDSSFYGKCLSGEFERVLEALGDCLQNPSFASEEIEPLRGEILTRLRERDNNTRSVAERRFLEALFPQ
ncbi:MAG: insulinase family protein, partial [Armatimonadetes bacterium]|nr:insulinase family protein [Armatimonadota bacterium]